MYPNDCMITKILKVITPVRHNKKFQRKKQFAGKFQGVVIKNIKNSIKLTGRYVVQNREIRSHQLNAPDSNN